MASRILVNYDTLQRDGESEKKVRRGAEDMARQIAEVATDAIITVRGDMFAVPKDGDPRLVADVDEFFAWLESQGIAAVWANGFMTKREFFRFFCALLPKHEQITELPHEPAIKGIYYRGSWEPTKYTGVLDELVDMWLPSTPADRSLIKAAFCTPFWGGAGGRRPAFFLEGDGSDHGRGVGKSTLMETIASLAGGYVDAKVDDAGAEFRKRLLNGEDSARVIAFDNVKAAKVSSADVEALITAQWISGHRYYKGEKRRGNYFTQVFTMNDASLSTDLCQRAVRIMLSRRPYSNEWLIKLDRLKERTREIIGDILCILRKPTPATPKNPIRFSDWHREVLCRVDPTPGVATTITERQRGVDADEFEANQLIEVIDVKIAEYRHPYGQYDEVSAEGPRHSYIIRAGLVQQWLREMYGKTFSAQAVHGMMTRANHPRIVPKTRKIRGCQYWLVLSDADAKKPDGIRGAYKIVSARDRRLNFAHFRGVDDESPLEIMSSAPAEIGGVTND